MATDTIVGGIAARYANALFDLAKDDGGDAKLETVRGDLASLKRMIEENGDLRQVVMSPVFARDDQARALDAIGEKAGFDRLTRNFLGVVARNRRLFALLDMITAYNAALARHRGEITAKVASAHPLTEAQVQKLKDTLKAQLQADVNVDATVDPSLLGGLVVRVGSKMIDTSLKTKLQNLEGVMKRAS